MSQVLEPVTEIDTIARPPTSAERVADWSFQRLTHLLAYLAVGVVILLVAQITITAYQVGDPTSSRARDRKRWQCQARLRLPTGEHPECPSFFSLNAQPLFSR